MRRKPGTLRPIEVAILNAGLRLRAQGIAEFHGFLIGKEAAELQSARALLAQGTLYRALGRLEQAGLLSSHWENPSDEAPAHRPLRRLYKVTIAGERAASEQRTLPHPAATPRRQTAT